MLGIAAAMVGFLKGFDSDNGIHPQVAFLKDLPIGVLSSNWIGDAWGLAVMLFIAWLLFKAARDPAK